MVASTHKSPLRHGGNGDREDDLSRHIRAGDVDDLHLRSGFGGGVTHCQRGVADTKRQEDVRGELVVLVLHHQITRPRSILLSIEDM